MYYNLGEFENGLHKKVNDIVSTVDRHSLPSGMVDDVNESPVVVQLMIIPSSHHLLLSNSS